MPKRAVLVLVVCSVGILGVLVGAVYALAIFVESVVLSVTINPISIRIALSCVFVAAALVLHLVKNSRGQFLYGILEVAVGLVVNWQSLDTWFHPAGGQDMANVIYGRLVVLAAGTYAIGRGISNVAEGYERFFPNLWPKIRAALTPTQIREWFVEGYHQPRVHLPTKQLKFHIWWLQDQIAALEKKLEAAVKAGRDTRLLQKRITLSRDELTMTTERFEKEVLGNTPEDAQAK